MKKKLETFLWGMLLGTIIMFASLLIGCGSSTAPQKYRWFCENDTYYLEEYGSWKGTEADAILQFEYWNGYDWDDKEWEQYGWKCWIEHEDV